MDEWRACSHELGVVACVEAADLVDPRPLRRFAESFAPERLRGLARFVAETSWP
jgi:hypothetical protein